MEPPRASSPLLDYAQDEIALLDEEGTYTYVNEAVERVRGFDAERLIGRAAAEDVHPDDRAQFRTGFDRVRSPGNDTRTETVTYRCRTADGSWVWLESRIGDPADSRLDGYVVSSRDVTDRENAREQRWETHTRLEEIADATEDVLWAFSGDWSELLFVNPAYESVYGADVDRLRENPREFLNCIHPEDVPAVEAAMDRLADGERIDVEYRVGPDADYGRWVWVKGEPIVEGDDVVRVVGFTRDVTDRRRRERQLAVVDNLLRHNVRNKVGEILGSAELVAEDSTGAADRIDVIRRAGEELVESAEKQRDIVDLLTGAGTPRRIDLSRAVDAAVGAVTGRFPDLTVDVDVPEGTIVRALGEVESAVTELLENAALYADGISPSVRVTARVDDGRMRLVVRDDCPPMPAFDHQVLTGDHEMDAVYHSSGVGLWLVYWIVDLSGGEIAYATPEGGGNEVAITLDRASK